MPITFGRSCVRIIRNSRDVQPTHFLTGRPELGVGTSQGVLGLKEGLAMAKIITMSGWLEKRGGFDASKSWKNRWCILSENMFRYFKTDSDNTPAGVVYAEDIDEVTEDLEAIDKHSFVFKVVTKGRTYLFNAVSNPKREEWISKIRQLVAAHTEDSIAPNVKYTTVEIFHGSKPGIRINGNIGTELMIKLSSGVSGKVIQDDRGWFAEVSTSHATLLNLFVQHGWTLSSSFSCNSIPSNGTQASHSDMMVLTAVNSD